MTPPTFELVIGEGCDANVAEGVRSILGEIVPERAVHEVGQADIVVAVEPLHEFWGSQEGVWDSSPPLNWKNFRCIWTPSARGH